MYLFKSLFIRTKNIQRQLEEAEQRGREKERYICEKEKIEEITDISFRYEKIIDKNKEVIRNYKKQHEDDIKAYKIFKNNLYEYQKECEDIREIVQIIFNTPRLLLQKIEEKNDKAESINRQLELKQKNINKLLRIN